MRAFKPATEDLAMRVCCSQTDRARACSICAAYRFSLFLSLAGLSHAFPAPLPTPTNNPETSRQWAWFARAHCKQPAIIWKGTRSLIDHNLPEATERIIGELEIVFESHANSSEEPQIVGKTKFFDFEANSEARYETVMNDYFKRKVVRPDGSTTAIITRGTTTLLQSTLFHPENPSVRLVARAAYEASSSDPGTPDNDTILRLNRFTIDRTVGHQSGGHANAGSDGLKRHADGPALEQSSFKVQTVIAEGENCPVEKQLEGMVEAAEVEALLRPQQGTSGRAGERSFALTSGLLVSLPETLEARNGPRVSIVWEVSAVCVLHEHFCVGPDGRLMQDTQSVYRSNK